MRFGFTATAPSTNLQAIRAAHKLNIPVLLRAESNLSDRPRSRKTLLAKRIFFAWLRKRIPAALSIGEANTAYWQHYWGADFPVFPCSYSVDNSFFQRECARASESREEFRRSLNLDPGRPGDLICVEASDQEALHRPGGCLPWTRAVQCGRRRFLTC